MYHKHNVSKKGFDIYLSASIKCPYCGHSCHFFKMDKIVCDWCGKYVFKTKQAEFEYKLKSRRNALKNEKQ